MAMTEAWAPVPGFERKYEVSDAGNVRSLKRVTSDGRTLPERIMKNYLDDNGYYRVKLSLDGKQQQRRIHRLMLLAFVGEVEGKPVARHLNGDPLDNRLRNLDWGTVADNSRDSLRHGTHFPARETHCRHGHAIDHFTGGKRRCLTCQRAQWKRAADRKRLRKGTALAERDARMKAEVWNEAGERFVKRAIENNPYRTAKENDNDF